MWVLFYILHSAHQFYVEYQYEVVYWQGLSFLAAALLLRVSIVLYFKMCTPVFFRISIGSWILSELFLAAALVDLLILKSAHQFYVEYQYEVGCCQGLSFLTAALVLHVSTVSYFWKYTPVLCRISIGSIFMMIRWDIIGVCPSWWLLYCFMWI